MRSKVTLPQATKALNVSQGKSQVVMADKARCSGGGPYPAYPVALRVTSWMSPPKRSYHREILLSLPDQDSVF